MQVQIRTILIHVLLVFVGKLIGIVRDLLLVWTDGNASEFRPVESRIAAYSNQIFH